MDSNMMADGVISLDDRPAIAAIDRANKGLDDHEKKTKTVLDRAGREWQVYGEGVVRVSDRGKTSLDRLLQSMEKQAAMAGKSGTDRLIAERDQLIRKWQDEEKAVQAITKAYDKMIAAQSGGGGWQGFGDSVKGFVQNPIQGAGNAVSGLLGKLGPMGTALSAGAAAMGAFALASFNAAKSLGEYGVQIRDVELRTGLTAKEVGQFSYAAKAVGQDVTIFERMMRGLSQAMDENSTEGEKARGMLQKLHVTLYDATTGGIKPTSQALQEIGAAIAALPTAFERDAAAMALFKRSGIEAIPVMVELSANLKTAKENGYGPSDEEIDRFLKYQRSVTQIETAWAGIVRHIKEAIVPTFDSGPEKVAPATGWVDRVRNWMLGANAAGDVGRPTGFLGLGRDFTKPAVPAAPAAAPVPPGLTDAQRSMIEAALSGSGESGAVQRAQKELEKTQKELSSLQAIGAPWEKMGPLAAKAEQQKAQIEAIKKAAEDAKHATEQLKQFRTQATEFEKKGDEAELGAIGKIYYQRDLLIKQAEHLKGVEADIAGIRKSADEQAGVIFKKDWDAFEKHAQEEQDKRNRQMVLMMGPSKGQLKEWEDQFKANDEIDSISLNSRKDTLNREAGQAQKMVGMSGLTGMDAIRATYQIRIDLAKQLANVEADRIAKEDRGALQAVDIARAQAAIQKDMDEAREEALMKQLELQKTQLDTIKKDTEGLWHTLMTKPQNFPKQLGSTIHEAVIKPVAEGMASVTANVLHPIIYGPDGDSGIAGMFKGAFGMGKQQDPMKVATNLNTDATVQNSTKLAILTALLSGITGIAAPAMATPAGIGGVSLPAISAPAVSGGGSAASFMGGSSRASWSSLASYPMSVAMGGGAAAGGGGVTTSADIPTLNPAASGGPGLLGNLLGGHQGGASPMSGIQGMLKGFNGIQWGGLTRSAGSNVVGYGPDGTPHDDMGNPVKDNGDGRITGVNGAAGAAMSAGGMMLAQQGLLGSSRGTWAGVGEGAAGGAMVGMQAGGPLGAVIGGVVGFGIGIGEKLAGVETPENEAKRLVKQLYSISIDNAMAKQIVSLAQQKYAGHVSIAVRDPDVRKMLELYAAGTGQKMPQSATTPRGGSLAEMGGNLYQQQSYVNGVGYTFASNLPVMGGPSGGTYPTPGSPNTSGGGGTTTIALNINGQPITPEFVTDQSLSAQNSSYNRVQQSANMQIPGLMVGT